MDKKAVSPETLYKTLEEVLKKNGKYDRLKAELRNSILCLLKNNSGSSADGSYSEIPPETLLINSLIREFLVWNGYKHAEEVFTVETGQKHGRERREKMTEKLGVEDGSNTEKIPLLYYIVDAFKEKDIAED